MTARVLIVKNIGREGPGLLRDVLMRHRVEADVMEIERGETLPDIQHYQAVIVLGGPASANDDTPSMTMQIECARQAIATNTPYLGISLGHQVLAKAAGAQVVPGKKEVGFFADDGTAYRVDLTDAGVDDPLFAGVDNPFPVFQLHGETVVPIAEVVVLGTSGEAVQAIRVGRKAYGLQMHVELVPEMLAVWTAQDEDLKVFDAADLQRQLADIHQTYASVGRQVFENFLAIAGLSSIDLTESDRSHVR